MRVRLDVDELRSGLGILGRELTKAHIRALNKTAKNVSVAANREIRQVRRGISARVVRKAITIVRATDRTRIAEVVVTGRPIPMRDYAAVRGVRGVTVNVTGKRMLIGPAGRRAFVVDRLGGHVFRRKGPKSLPIEKLWGPSLPTALTNERIEQRLLEVAREMFAKRLREEIRFVRMRR